MDIMKGLKNGMGIIGVLAVLLIGTVVSMVFALILFGILLDSVVPGLGLSASIVANITAIINTAISFISSLGTGLTILASLVLLVIVIAVFAGIGLISYGIYKKRKGGSGGNF